MQYIFRPEAYIPGHLDRKSWRYVIASSWRRGRLISSNRLLTSGNHSVDTEEEAGLPQHGRREACSVDALMIDEQGCVYVIM